MFACDDKVKIFLKTEFDDGVIDFALAIHRLYDRID
jgi:hypothetical protein